MFAGTRWRGVIMRVVMTIAAVLMLAFAPAHAAGVSKSEVAKILSDAGHNVRDYDSDKLRVDVGGYAIIIWIAGADADISYITWLRGIRGEDISLELLNKFNNDVKFGRVYVDRDGDVALQMDRNSSGGVSSANIESDFEVFLLLISKFLSDLESQRIA